jgi:hypothetical protein
MRIALFLASRIGRVSRVVLGVVLALAGAALFNGLVAFLVIMLGAEIAVGGALGVCILCPLFGQPFEVHRLRPKKQR